MARPIKKGIDYFSFDTDFFEDPKIKRLKHMHGSLGIILYINILTRLYRECGYYIIIEEDILIDIAEYFKTSVEDIEMIIDYAVSIGLFKETELLNKVTVLTSERIQRSYQASVKVRGKKNKIKVVRSIWMLSESETEEYIEIE